MSQVARPDQIENEDWRLKALDLRRAGKPFRVIAEELGKAGGPASVSRAHELVIEALADLRERCREATQDIRDLEIQRCDGMIDVLWARLNDTTKKLNARSMARLVDSILRIQDRKARYLGLDAPKRIEASGAGGAPLLPPGSITIALVRPGEPIPPIPATNPAPGATEPGPDATKAAIDATPRPRPDEPAPPYK